MAKRPPDSAFHYLRKMASVHINRELSDADLLERFAGGNDEAAFTILIERHGPMVLGVCQRALPNSHDAEDACQATFLVLVRKAASIRKKTSLSSWLHGVACRVTVKMKRDRARQKNRERECTAPEQKDAAAEITWREVQAILDEELRRLPERYRSPLILCYLECMTRDQAASNLGLSQGSLHGRLERSRDLLRERLVKRGLSLSTVISASALGETISQAAMAPTFVISLTKAAMLFSAGQSLAKNTVATNVLALTHEVLKSMYLTKLKSGAGVLLCASLLFAVIAGSSTSVLTAQEVKPKSAPQNQGKPLEKTEQDADFIRRISKDLRGTEPSPAEVHFFVVSKDAGKRQKLIDLFIQERQAKQIVADVNPSPSFLFLNTVEYTLPLLDFNSPAVFSQYFGNLSSPTLLSNPNWIQTMPSQEIRTQPMPPRADLGTLQKDFYKELQTAKEKGDVSKFTQAYLDRLIDFLKTNPKSQDVPDVMRQIVLVYESQDKLVEAAAWHAKLLKEFPKAPTGTYHNQP